MAFTETVLKFAPWSFSKAGCMGTCELQFFKKYVEKKKDTSASSQSKVGNVVHKVLEDAVQDPALSLEGLMQSACEEFKLTIDETIDATCFLPKIGSFLAFTRKFVAQHKVKQILVEFEAAIFPDFSPASYSDPGALIRGKIDLGLITGNNDLVLFDHKSGKKKPLSEHSTQFNVYRLMGAAKYPDLRAIQCAIHYVEDGDVQWDRPMTIAQINSQLRPWMEVFLNKNHYALERMLQSGAPEPKTSWACSFCGQVNDCPAGQAEFDRRAAEKDKKKRLKVANV